MMHMYRWLHVIQLIVMFQWPSLAKERNEEEIRYWPPRVSVHGWPSPRPSPCFASKRATPMKAPLDGPKEVTSLSLLERKQSIIEAVGKRLVRDKYRGETSTRDL